jgi:hypothetical protein
MELTTSVLQRFSSLKLSEPDGIYVTKKHIIFIIKTRLNGDDGQKSYETFLQYNTCLKHFSSYFVLAFEILTVRIRKSITSRV